MKSFSLSLCVVWQWTALVLILESPLMAAARTVSVDTSLKEHCPQMCMQGIGGALGCDCSTRKKLVKRFAVLDPDTSRDRAEFSLLLEALLGSKDYDPLVQGGELKDSSARYLNDEDLEKIPLVHKRAGGYLRHGLTDDAEEEAIKMVRSKKRWLSLHDEFDSKTPDGELAVPPMWQDEASRKAFRYG